jgi:hypothetical protein
MISKIVIVILMYYCHKPEELRDRKVAAPVYKTENTDVVIRHAVHVASSTRNSWQSLRRQEAVARSV